MALRQLNGNDHRAIRVRSSLPPFVEDCKFGEKGTLNLPLFTQAKKRDNLPEANPEGSAFFLGSHLEKTAQLVLYTDLTAYRIGKHANFWDLLYQLHNSDKEDLNLLYAAPVILISDLPMGSEGGDKTSSGFGVGVFYMFEHLIRERKANGLRTYLQSNDDLQQGSNNSWWRKSFLSSIMEGFILCTEK